MHFLRHYPHLFHVLLPLSDPIQANLTTTNSLTKVKLLHKLELTPSQPCCEISTTNKAGQDMSEKSTSLREFTAHSTSPGPVPVLPMPIHPGEASQRHPWALLAGSERLWWFCCPNQGLSVGISNSRSPICQPKVVLPIFLHVPVCWRPSGADDFLCLLPAFFFSFILFIISSTVEKTEQNQYKNILH